MARLFQGGRLSDQFDAKDLWTHSIAVGVTSRLLHQAQGKRAGSEEAFLAGLIHDLGLLIEKQAFAEKLTEVVTKVEREKCDFCETEIAIIGADHQAFGVGLTTKWKFPRHLRAAVGFHHNPQDLSPELRNIATLIHIGDVLCCENQHGFHLTAQGESITDDMLDTLSITHAQLDEIRANLADQITEAEISLGA